MPNNETILDGKRKWELLRYTVGKFKTVITSRDFSAIHPWFFGFRVRGVVIPDRIVPNPSAIGSLDLSAPILFLARGHSGTTPLTKILFAAGVYMGNPQDRRSLNRTLDSLYWAFGFQQTMLLKLFEPGIGCLMDEHTVTSVGLECLRRHLSAYAGGPWGFKTGAGMFCHPHYRYLFPRAKFIYLIRDGRDVILSNNGYFHLTQPLARRIHGGFLKIITFGISDDIHTCPFEFPKRMHMNDETMKHRFWIQAKSWREHVRMMEHLRVTGRLSQNILTIRYEELCRDPVPVLEELFPFLELECTAEVKAFATRLLHTESVGRWKEYKRHVSDCNEDMEAVFATMEPELELLGYHD